MIQAKTILYLLSTAAVISVLALVITPAPNTIGMTVENEEPQANTSSAFEVSVTGTGTVYLDPDKVAVTLGVETNAQTAEEAQQQNSQKMNQVMSSLKALGIPENQIKTTTYRLYADYDWTQNGKVFKGYKVMHYVMVTCYDTSRAGEILDTASENGANYIGQVSFGLKDETLALARQQAIEKAVQNAEGEASSAAEAMAEATGNTLIRLDPTSLSVGYQYYTPYRGYPAAAPEGVQDTQLEPGQVSVTVSVNAAFNASLGIPVTVWN